MPQPQTTTAELPPIAFAAIQGRNGSDSSFFISDRQCVEAYNVDWFRSSAGRKRGGADAISLTGGTAAGNGILSAGRHVPSDDETAAEAWTVDGNKAFHRLAGGTAWADITVLDALQSNPQEVIFKSFNGKLYVAYKSLHNRMHVWDGTSLRRTSLDTPAALAAPTLAAGAITDTRRYRVSWTKQSGGVTVNRSNLGTASASVTYAAQQGTFTRPALPGEGETHWELWAAQSPFTDYRLVTTTVVGTTTAVDNTGTFSTLTTVAPADGANTPLPSARYITADDARLIMGGAWETSSNAENAMVPKVNRIWWTSILGASDVGDDERVSNTGTINSFADIEEAVTAISEPLQVVTAASSSFERGSFYVFSYRNQWKFVATGDGTAPYLRFKVSGGAGCIHHKSLCAAQNDNGNPAIYWWSPNGPYRISTDGQQFIGEDIQDLIATVNLDATIPCHAHFYPDLHQVWFYVATGSHLYPNRRVIFDTRLGKAIDVAGVRLGWALHEGESTNAYCSFLFSDTIGATMSRRLKPYIGYSGGTALWKCDTTSQTDNGTTFQAYLQSKSYAPWGIGHRGGLRGEPIVIAGVSAGTRIFVSLSRDEGIEVTTGIAKLSATSETQSETKVARYAEGAKLGGSISVSMMVGDAAPVASSWNLDAVMIPVTYEGEL